MSRRVSLCMQPGRPGFNIGSAQDGKPSCLRLSLLSRLPSRRTSRIIHLTCNWFSNKPPPTRREHEHVCARRHARTVTGRKRTKDTWECLITRGQCSWRIYVHTPQRAEVSRPRKVLRKIFLVLVDYTRTQSKIQIDKASVVNDQ